MEWKLIQIGAHFEAQANTYRGAILADYTSGNARE